MPDSLRSISSCLVVGREVAYAQMFVSTVSRQRRNCERCDAYCFAKALNRREECNRNAVRVLKR